MAIFKTVNLVQAKPSTLPKVLVINQRLVFLDESMVVTDKSHPYEIRPAVHPQPMPKVAERMH